MRYLLPLLILILACQRPPVQILQQQLVNDNGWYAYTYKHTKPGQADTFITKEPYLLLREYGNSCVITTNGKIFLNYTDGATWLDTSTSPYIRYRVVDDTHFEIGEWKDDLLTIEVKEVSPDHLWIAYEWAGFSTEYKLRPIP